MRSTLGLAVAVVTLACQASSSSTNTGAGGDPGAPVPSASVAADYYPYTKRGTGVIDGQAFVVVRGGDVLLDTKGYLTTISDNTRTASGSDVTLDPATPYAMGWFLKYGTSLRRFDNVPNDAAFRAARKTTVADESGRFRFEGLPPGRYIVRTTITWETPRDSYRMMRQGGVASAIVDLVDGEEKTLIMRHISENP